ncbi:putative AAA family ATPase SAP1 LALA0_S08e03356g [Lachancea lanzarotensis]|uniref:LALA0S08e03356g1_1 n=1 Tax=Lachancea lanzarotensis TaxID=1245769 RepID=A0A0C7NCX8_9SACH|nr:uncharacterized protein LALA0_S08e03356g [Lachancea lanzarotensis]CEP63476.1 LALA0S08e03356g1_1 [Lachancea lanzarotensis]
MDSGKEKGLLTRFTRIRKRPQQPLTDLTDIYSRIANESIYYLNLEEKGEFRKAISGLKSLNTHVLYALTQIEHQYPNTQHYSRDELSIQNGVRELLHRSQLHLERVMELEKQHGPPATINERPMVKRPPPPTMGSRSMLKTLREPHLGQYNKSYTVSAPTIAASNNTSGRSNSYNGKINFTTSKPLKTQNSSDVFKEFDEEEKLVDFTDDEDEDAKSDQTLGFDVQDYFDDYLDVDQGEMKRLEALNSLEGVRKDVLALSMDTKPIGTKHLEPTAPLKQTRSTSALEQKKPVPKHVVPPVPKHVVPPVPKPLVTANPTSSRTPASAPRSATKKTAIDPSARSLQKPSKAQRSQSAQAVRTRSAPSAKKEPPVVNKRVIRAKKPTVAIMTGPTRTVVNSKKAQISRAQTASQPATPPSTDQRKKAVKTAPTSTKPDEDESSSPENDSDIDQKALKEKLEDEIIAQLRGVDPAAAKQIFSEIVVHGDEVHWDDIAGLEAAKSSLKEAVVYPFLRPDLFRGLREPVRGMLLFGPPGTGKTMLARAVATESNSTFFSISASSLTSKYLGESEKLVRALFAIARKLSPSIVFVDEIDSIMGSRNNEGENESSRRIKNEFLVQWSSLSSAAAGKKGAQPEDGDDEEEDERVLVLAATNLPWSIDEAARRRFVRRQYIPLPEMETRKKQLAKLLTHQKHTLTDEDFDEVLQLTDGYSGSDITSLAKDAAMGPLRELGDKLLFTPRDQIRPIALHDVKNSLCYIKPSVSTDGLEQYEDWAQKFGSSGV